MTSKKRKQLLILLFLLIVLIAAYAGLKLYKNKIPEEEEIISYQVTDISSDDVAEIGITNEYGTMNYKKEEDIWFYLEEEEMQTDSTIIENLIVTAGTITSQVKIEDVTDMAQYGLEEPVCSITLQWENNMYTVKIGDYNSVIGSYYVSVNDEKTVYTADSTLYYALNKTADDFKKAEEAPEATADTAE